MYHYFELVELRHIQQQSKVNPKAHLILLMWNRVLHRFLTAETLLTAIKLTGFAALCSELLM